MLHGKHSTQNKIQVTVGDYAPTVTRKVGEEWTDDDGNEWEQKEGYATKMGKEGQQELRKELSTFSNCPKEVCTCTLPNHLDKKMKAIHNMCFDCVIAMEHKLRIQGKYKEYEKEDTIKGIIVRANMFKYIQNELPDVQLGLKNFNRSLQRWARTLKEKHEDVSTEIEDWLRLPSQGEELETFVKKWVQDCMIHGCYSIYKEEDPRSKRIDNFIS